MGLLNNIFKKEKSAQKARIPQLKTTSKSERKKIEKRNQGKLTAETPKTSIKASSFDSHGGAKHVGKKVFSGIQPHIAEKATFLSEKGVYVFKVKKGMNKIEISQAVNKMYKVSPIRVNIANMPAKKRVVRGRGRMKPGFKKAMVYLKKGDKIET